MSIKVCVDKLELIRIVTWFETIRAIRPDLLQKGIDQDLYGKLNGKLARVSARESADKSGENRPHRVKEQNKQLDIDEALDFLIKETLARGGLPEECKLLLHRSTAKQIPVPEHLLERIRLFRNSMRPEHQRKDGIVFGYDKGVGDETAMIHLERKAERCRAIDWFDNPFEKPPRPRFKLIEPDDILLGDFIWEPTSGVAGRVVTIVHTPPQAWAAGFTTFKVDVTKTFGQAYGTGYMRGDVKPINVFNWQKEKRAVKIYKAF